MNSSDNLWIVTCADLHSAVGIFLGVESALSAARVLTDRGGCVYLPVKLQVLGRQDLEKMKSLESVKTVETLDSSEKMLGGYL